MFETPEILKAGLRICPKGVCTECPYIKIDNQCFEQLKTDALEYIEQLEAQVPKQAEWIGLEYDGFADGYPVYDLWECTECGMEWRGEENTLPSYCPDCGARMREAEYHEDT